MSTSPCVYTYTVYVNSTYLLTISRESLWVATVRNITSLATEVWWQYLLTSCVRSVGRFVLPAQTVTNPAKLHSPLKLFYMQNHFRLAFSNWCCALYFLRGLPHTWLGLTPYEVKFSKPTPYTLAQLISIWLNCCTENVNIPTFIAELDAFIMMSLHALKLGLANDTVKRELKKKWLF